MNNPYDLTKLIASNSKITEKKQYRPDVITPDEKKQLLVGYEKLSHDKWLQLFPGSHIRYMRKDGEMRKGGYVRYVDIDNQNLYLSTFPLDIPNAKGWKLPLDGVAEIWVVSKHNTKIPTTSCSNDLREDLISLKEDVKQLKIEIQRITNQQKRILRHVETRLNRIEDNLNRFK